MIAVTGEALIDLVVDRDGRVAAQPGGGPFNTARTIGRLGLAPIFLGRLSRDTFGALLRASLDRDGVTLGCRTLPTSPPLSPSRTSTRTGWPGTTSTSPGPRPVTWRIPSSRPPSRGT